MFCSIRVAVTKIRIHLTEFGVYTIVISAQASEAWRPFLPTAWLRKTASALLLRYAGRHSMHDPWRGSGLAHFLEKQAPSLQSCAFWRTRSASILAWTDNLMDCF